MLQLGAALLGLPTERSASLLAIEAAEDVLESKCGVAEVMVTQGFVAKNPKVSVLLCARCSM